MADERKNKCVNHYSRNSFSCFWLFILRKYLPLIRTSQQHIVKDKNEKEVSYESSLASISHFAYAHLFISNAYTSFSRQKLIPMGEAIGIQLQLSHVFVAHDVLLASNQWMKGGAVIEKINDIPVKSLAEAKQAVAKDGQQNGRSIVKANKLHWNYKTKKQSMSFPF